MTTITLTTDWIKDDFYIGALKGKLLSLCKDVNIVDITHKIKPLNLSQAAFIIRNTYSHFPPGTIHIIGVKSVPPKGNDYLLVEKDNQYFIGADNGIFGLLFSSGPDRIIKLSVSAGYPSFPALSVFAENAAALVSGESPESLGEESHDIYKRVPLRPTIDESVIIGRIVYIDSFSNAITNITKDLFYRVANNRKFQIFVQSNTHKINNISKTYNDKPEGELIALFNSLNLLEIAMNGGNAAELLALSTDSTVRVRFK
ncbi:MAG: S-adenosyl-l-methionine hydroxide adenosyltransferase family protein [Bacteroidales bacterium]